MASTKKKTGSPERTTKSARGGGASSGEKRTAITGRGASRSKGRGTGKRTNARGAASGKKGASRQEETLDYALYTEIVLWIVLALAVLCFISMLGFGGKVGKAVAAVISGCFGIMGYLFPFAVFFLAAFLISNVRSRIARLKAFGAILLFIDLCAMMQMALVGVSDTYTLSQYYEAGALYHTGGGVAGGALASLFARGIGSVGTWVMLVILLIISLILLTQRSLIKGVKRGGRQIVVSARAGRSDRAAWRQEREQERLRRQLAETYPAKEEYDPDSLGDFSLSAEGARRTRHAAGVTKDTRLTAGIETGEVRQILPPLSEDAGKDGPQPFPLDMPQKEEAPPSVGAEPGAMGQLRRALQDASRRQKSPSPKTVPFFSDELLHRALKREDESESDLEQSLPWEEDARREEDPQKEADLEVRTREGEKSKEQTGKQSEEQSGETADDGALPPEAQEKASCAQAKTERRRHAGADQIQKDIDCVAAQIQESEARTKPVYRFPSLDLLKKPAGGRSGTTETELRETARKLQQVFETFGVNVHITNVTCGPSVTRYELTPQMGVKVSRIVNLQDDIKLNLAASDIRIEAPIPGKAAVGIEVPNKKATGVMLRELLESEEFLSHPSRLAYAVGRDIAGKIIVSDIAKMPHLLIAGATGSGKSVFINTLIMSILYKASPEEVKMIMIDPKVVELSVYNGIPHLFIPVVTDPKKAAGALNWAVSEMMARYQKFADTGVRDLKGYNRRVEGLGDVPQEDKPEKLPQIVIIVDELADLMMVASAEVEDAICRLAQLARAAGIHLVIATQRPSVDVITGLIKANMPSRIAFSVSSGVDSRTILDTNGAEKLLGNGDMLFAPQTYKQPLRVQGAYVSDQEVAKVAEFLKDQGNAEDYGRQMEERLENIAKTAAVSGQDGDVDELFVQAGKFIIEKDKASIGMLQRWFKIGFNRAARIMDQLSEAGVVGPEEGTKPRKVLMSEEEFDNYREQH